ncbi:alcohol oxidase [Pseudovirgaria hyperparasitica]|uniref:Alcohol oxidase n=1 Tax=Pseudovirgaria hyperparasitica TaxID=470096 RepID=A0A6A6W590_9PEZI|nr:alcohol oxidase [Pseudovirgaria hyperparasitica]KAF2757339.1 alcohol oxidase [Pseudovirgaria hyperparasitica]
MMRLLHVLATLSIASICACMNETYDYIILGGGTAGLALANRLSADCSIRVAVIEAGGSVYDDARVKNVSAFGLAQNTELDWLYAALPDEDGRVLNYSAGRALGGEEITLVEIGNGLSWGLCVLLFRRELGRVISLLTSVGMTYIRAESVQIDAWETVGNTGWTWSSLLPFYKKSETFTRPDAVREAKGATYVEAVHGKDGNVGVGWSSYLMGQNVSGILRATNEALGWPFNEDPNDGTVRGFSTWPQTLNAETDIRSDAARAYYWGKAETRENLHVFTRTQALRILWGPSPSSTGNNTTHPRAIGVEILTPSNATSSIHLSPSPLSELIISLGSLRSPLLLEHSGIGHPSVLAAHSIPLVHALPGVGMHMQDQPNNAFVYESKVPWTGYPTFATMATAPDILRSATHAFEATLTAHIPDMAAHIARTSLYATSPAAQDSLLRVQAALLFNSSTPAAELLWAPFGPQVILAFWPLLPFARGSVHVASNDPLDAPAITPNMWMFEYDVAMAVALAKAVRAAYATPPLSGYVGAELVPGLDAVPADASDAVWAGWIKASYGSNNHPVGTCAMLPLERGGVVDGEGRVYGVRGVRVVDASVMGQVSGHLSATVYAVAERIASLILEGRGG